MTHCHQMQHYGVLNDSHTFFLVGVGLEVTFKAIYNQVNAMHFFCSSLHFRKYSKTKLPQTFYLLSWNKTHPWYPSGPCHLVLINHTFLTYIHFLYLFLMTEIVIPRVSIFSSCLNTQQSEWQVSVNCLSRTYASFSIVHPAFLSKE